MHFTGSLSALNNKARVKKLLRKASALIILRRDRLEDGKKETEKIVEVTDSCFKNYLICRD